MVPCQKRSAFAFVELLVVMFIVVVLYAVIVGPSREYLQRQKLARCAENLRKLHLTLTLYANEHDGAFPAADGARNSDEALTVLVPKYSSDRSIFSCPATGHTGGQSDFAYVAGLRKDGPVSLLASDAQVNVEPKRSGARIFADAEGTRGGNHGKTGGNLIFTDGHAETISIAAPRDLSPPPGTKLLNPAK